MVCSLGIYMSNPSRMESHNWIPCGSPQHIVKYTANSVDVQWTLARWNESRMCKQTSAWWDLNVESISWWVWMEEVNPTSLLSLWKESEEHFPAVHICLLCFFVNFLKNKALLVFSFVKLQILKVVQEALFAGLKRTVWATGRENMRLYICSYKRDERSRVLEQTLQWPFQFPDYMRSPFLDWKTLASDPILTTWVLLVQGSEEAKRRSRIWRSLFNDSLCFGSSVILLSFMSSRPEAHL